MLLGRDFELTAMSSVMQNTEQGIAINNDDLVWNEGAWLSFLASIEDQQEYLGPLTLIWEVQILGGCTCLKCYCS